MDVISHGRLVFGIGAGWWEPDYLQYGFEFGTAIERLRKLDEATQIILGLWTQKETTFEGKHYRVHGAVNVSPKAFKPHIPLMIAGGGEKVTLKLVARYGDACNIMDSPEVAAHKFAVLEKHCQDVDRDNNTINRTVTTLALIADTNQKARPHPAEPPVRLPGRRRLVWSDRHGRHARKPHRRLPGRRCAGTHHQLRRPQRGAGRTIRRTIPPNSQRAFAGSGRTVC